MYTVECTIAFCCMQHRSYSLQAVVPCGNEWDMSKTCRMKVEYQYRGYLSWPCEIRKRQPMQGNAGIEKSEFVLLLPFWTIFA